MMEGRRNSNQQMMENYNRSPNYKNDDRKLPENLLTEESHEQVSNGSRERKYSSQYMNGGNQSRNQNEKFENIYRPSNYNTIDQPRDIPRIRESQNQYQDYSEIHN